MQFEKIKILFGRKKKILPLYGTEELKCKELKKQSQGQKMSAGDVLYMDHRSIEMCVAGTGSLFIPFTDCALK